MGRDRPERQAVGGVGELEDLDLRDLAEVAVDQRDAARELDGVEAGAAVDAPERPVRHLHEVVALATAHGIGAAAGEGSTEDREVIVAVAADPDVRAGGVAVEVVKDIAS